MSTHNISRFESWRKNPKEKFSTANYFWLFFDKIRFKIQILLRNGENFVLGYVSSILCNAGASSCYAGTLPSGRYWRYLRILMFLITHSLYDIEKTTNSNDFWLKITIWCGIWWFFPKFLIFLNFLTRSSKVVSMILPTWRRSRVTTEKMNDGLLVLTFLPFVLPTL